MKSAGVILICSALVAAGVRLASDIRKKESIYKSLSVFFKCLASRIGQYDCNIFQALEKTCTEAECKDLSFPAMLCREQNPGELREHWSEAVLSDVNLNRIEKEEVLLIARLAHRLSDASAETFSGACKELADIFLQKKEWVEKSRAKNEKLIYSVSFLGAAALFILFI